MHFGIRVNFWLAGVDVLPVTHPPHSTRPNLHCLPFGYSQTGFGSKHVWVHQYCLLQTRKGLQKKRELERDLSQHEMFNEAVLSSFSKPGYQHCQQFEYGILGASASILWQIPGLLRIVSPSPFTFRSMGNLINTLLPVLAYHPCKQSLLFLNSGTFWTWFTVTPGAVQSQT